MKFTALGDRWFASRCFMLATIYPALAESSQVIAVDLQGHGRTADIDRPLTFPI